MNDLITVNNTNLTIKNYNGKRVVTLKDVDDVHVRPEGTAKRNFIENKDRLVEGEDFFFVKPSDIRKNEFRTSEINNRGTYLITESGYLMLVKSFTDDLAWSVQRALVNTYFRPVVQERRNPTSEYAAETRAKAMATNAMVRSAKLMVAEHEKAGIAPQYTVLALHDIYRENGIALPPPPLMAEKTYDATEMADRLGVLSKNGKPHAHAVGAILRSIDITPDMIIHAPYDRHGHAADYDRYKSPVLDMVSRWLSEREYPCVITLGGKKYNVSYRSTDVA